MTLINNETDDGKMVKTLEGKSESCLDDGVTGENAVWSGECHGDNGFDFAKYSTECVEYIKILQVLGE